MKNNKTNTFEDLIVWQKAHEFVLSIYQLCKELPEDEKYALISQIKRASMSIPSNIAEGYGRKGNKDKLRFYTIARASLLEVRYFLILIEDLKYHKTTEYKEKVNEIEKMLYAYTSKIKI